MERLRLLLNYLADYKGYFTLNVVFNLVGVAFTLVGISSMMPLIELLFKADSNSILEFLKPNPNTAFSRKYLEYEVNHWFANSISEAPSFVEGKKRTLFIVCLFISGSFFFKNLFLYLANFFLAPVRNGIIANLRNDVYQKMLNLPVSYYSDEKKGDLMSKMSNDVMQVESGMIAFQRFLREPIQVIIFLFGLFFISWKLSLVVLLLLPLSAFFVSIIGKGLKRTSKKAQGQLGQVLSVVEETLSAIKLLKGFAAESSFIKSFKKHNKRFYELRNRQIRKSSASSPISETIGIAVFAIVMWIGGNIVFDTDDGLRGATLITFLMYMWGLLSPLKALIGAINNLQVSMVSMNRLDEILKANEKSERMGGQKIDSFKNEIRLNNVRFKYENEEVIKGVDLIIPKGKTIALVGHSGSGKSTIADLLPRFYNVTGGSILIDDKNINELDVKSLRKLTGIVTQDSILFNDSVRNNLSLGVEGLTDDQILKALTIANAKEFVMDLDDGLETTIGEGGGKLSGGQRQRLCIARAVLQNPPLLILDEATSALDTTSEMLVQQALEKVMKGRTALVIAHRLSTIKNADTIVVMDQGLIVEEGSHEELYARKSYYYKLCSMQELN
tara:strand:- start:3136 stop:4980 length:1845 start_codon:yes stop_codon:yes gene_type:complete